MLDRGLINIFYTYFIYDLKWIQPWTYKTMKTMKDPKESSGAIDWRRKPSVNWSWSRWAREYEINPGYDSARLFFLTWLNLTNLLRFVSVSTSVGRQVCECWVESRQLEETSDMSSGATDFGCFLVRELNIGVAISGTSNVSSQQSLRTTTPKKMMYITYNNKELLRVFLKK